MASRDERDRFLVQLGQRLEAIDEPEKIYKAALALIVRQMGGEGGAIVLRHPVTGDLRTIDWGKAGRWEEGTIRDFLELTVEQRHFPKEISAPQFGQRHLVAVPGSHANADFPALDQIHCVAFVAGAEQKRAGFAIEAIQQVT